MPHNIVQTESSLREVHDTITEMMQQLANEPSVGLYFVQQHVHKAVPAMVQLKTQIVDATQKAEYVTQDVKEARNAVRTIKECGPPVIERMIKTLDGTLPRLPSFRHFRSEELAVDSTAGTSSLTEPADIPTSISRSPSGREPLVTDSAYFGYVRNIFDSAIQKASYKANAVAGVAKWTSSGRVDVATPVVGGDGPLEAVATTSGGEEKSVASISAPGEFVRGLFRADILQPAESWGNWLPTLPTQALRTGLSKISGSKVREESQTKATPPKEDDPIKDLLQVEGDSYASFTAERAVVLEKWLDVGEHPEVNGP
ncbi:hypothetical protein R1sor_014536 [Riccia sorocarpa]|uniref:Uncharacterized protein n=1 Tax=Riccia sorocarpa TaxID=122646 RepID=A0ABD3HCN8_9MARC